eukprot:PhF_6_TR21186/c0_g1_i1/m.30551
MNFLLVFYVFVSLGYMVLGITTSVIGEHFTLMALSWSLTLIFAILGTASTQLKDELHRQLLKDIHIFVTIGALLCVEIVVSSGREGVAALALICFGCSRSLKYSRVVGGLQQSGCTAVFVLSMMYSDSRSTWLPLDVLLWYHGTALSVMYCQVSHMGGATKRIHRKQSIFEQHEDSGEQSSDVTATTPSAMNSVMVTTPPPMEPTNSPPPTTVFGARRKTTDQCSTPSSNSGEGNNSTSTVSFASLGIGLECRTTRVKIPTTSDTKQKTLNWKKGVLLSRGAFGEVHVGLNEDDGGMMAVKTVLLDPHDTALVSKIAMLTSEVSILKNFPHPNVVKYYFVEKLDNGLNIFMEYVSGGSVASVLHQFGGLSELATVQYAYQTLVGLAHLHEHSIVHADIKCANLLVTVDGIVKIADFGAACIAPDKVHLGVSKGTPLWMAPEVLRGEPFGIAADIWSFGCSVLEMLTGTVPWKNIGDTVTAMGYVAGLSKSNNATIELPDTLSDSAKTFLLECLQPDPADRLSARDLLGHDFFFEPYNIGDGGSLRRISKVSPALHMAPEVAEFLRSFSSHQSSFNTNSWDDDKVKKVSLCS